MANPSQDKLPTIRIENLGAAQSNVPFTFGQVFAVGHVKPGEGLSAVLEDGSKIALQFDQKATHPDGSVRHAVLSGVLPKIDKGVTETLQLAKSDQVKGKFVPDLAGLAGSVEITIDGVKYTAGALSGKAIEWLSGHVVAESIVDAPLVDAKGNPHPHLTVRAGIRGYVSKHARIEVIIENTKTFAPGANNFKYDVSIKLAGKVAFERQGLMHYHHARWRKVFWTGGEPLIHVQHDPEYVIGTKAVSNYDRSATPLEKNLESVTKRVTDKNTEIMEVGPINKAMGTTGGRPDIGPLPSWYVMYLLSADKRPRDVMMAAAEGSGSWSIHYRDENTGYPVRTDNEKNKNISTHMNLSNKGPLPVPRFATGKGTLSTPLSNDTAHQPSFAYLPYLLTGDYYFLEELQFWATSNTLETDPGNRGYEKGLVNWQQVRGQAWSLRTLGHAAYITPDSHPLKDYFIAQLGHNLDVYHATYVEGNPNQLGVYDGSGKNSFQITASAPWQDDFLTWSFGYLVELGFDKARPILEWKAKYPVGRMTTPGFCQIAAAAYYMEFRPGPKEPLFSNLADMYQFNFGGDKISFESKALKHPKGLKFIDQPCGSKEQADWMTATNGFTWAVGRMGGFSDSNMGYPSNMQPALAVAATLGVTKADEAWARFESRAAKPDYRTGPQFAIVPRPKESLDEPHVMVETVNRDLTKSDAGKLIDSQMEEGYLYTVVIIEQ